MHRRLIRSVLVLSLLLCPMTAVAIEGIVWGQEGTVVWIQFTANGPGDGFRIDAGPRAGTCRLVFPHESRIDPHVLKPGLPSLAEVRIEPAETGGMSLVIPLPLGGLRGVERDGDSWRFRFDGASVVSRGPPTDEYRLGIRDVIEISVFGHTDMNRSVAVPPDGVINYPLVGDVKVFDRTVEEIETELERRLGEEFLVNPQVNVQVKEYESKWVNVIGMVRTPGKYPIKGRTTLIDIITQAGGLTEVAGDRIILSRPTAEQTARLVEISRDDLFSVDNENVNVLMAHGDVVDVPERAVFYIQGEVGRPGAYPLDQGYTLLKAISIAGGFSQWADRKSVQILREDGGDQQTITLNAKAISARKQPDMELRPEDIIIVKRRLL